jgi:DmsE family decaheme c-type cytochrome
MAHAWAWSAVLIWVVWAPAVAAQTTQVPANEYVGSQVCRGCHAAQWEFFFRNPHFKSIAAGEARDRAGCEGCHGPGRNHVRAGGGADTILAFSRMKPPEALAQCLTCHQEDLGKLNVRRSPHTLAQVVCTNCHSIHGNDAAPALLVQVQRELCFDCHNTVRAQFSMPFKHRVNEGLMDCTDCHNPHGTPAPAWRMGIRPRMTLQALANEQSCLRCHSEFRGPFVFEHAAVRVDGCEVCHEPHGSANPRLLRRPVTFPLCLECHSGGGNFGRHADGIQLQSPTHNMADPRFQNCTTCHVRIHGSNSDRRFLR